MFWFGICTFVARITADVLSARCTTLVAINARLLYYYKTMIFYTIHYAQ
jgi:hypothetical protein